MAGHLGTVGWGKAMDEHETGGFDFWVLPWTLLSEEDSRGQGHLSVFFFLVLLSIRINTPLVAFT